MDERPMLGLETEAEYETEELSADQKRTARAVSEQLIIVPTLQDDGTATGIYEVFSQSRSVYVLDPSNGACNCPDMMYSEPENGCKHLRAIYLQERVDDDFPRRNDDAAAYLDRLQEVVEIMEVRRDMLATEVFDDGDLAVEPSAPTDEYRTVDWFVEKLTDHDSLA